MASPPYTSVSIRSDLCKRPVTTPLTPLQFARPNHILQPTTSHQPAMSQLPENPLPWQDTSSPAPQALMLLSTFRTLRRAALVFALCSTAAFAQKTINIPADYPTIQAGINAASNGDTVLVAPGTYFENIDFKGKGITVTSSNAAVTTIDGGSKGPAVSFKSGEPRAAVPL